MQKIIKLLKSESATGILLITFTIIAMLIANSPLNQYYQKLINIYMVISIDNLVISKPILLWINDGLMAIFFFMVGLEIKREMVLGSLKEKSKVITPVLAAIGGMVVPAIIYISLNIDNESNLRGWAIPMATDIAFALGVLSLLGDKVPKSLKTFLLTLAIIDDLGAILVIALFYSSGISLAYLGFAVLFFIVLLILNLKKVKNTSVYMLLGLFLWVAFLKSGVHATIAGVVLGLMIPLKGNEENFLKLEHSLHFPVNYIILPIFAFVNTGISLSGVDIKDFTDSVTIGIVSGLVFGKSLGIFLFSYLSNVSGIGKLPPGIGYRSLFGLSLLGGIGFTMSLFIGSLAFECSDGVCFDVVDERIGILLGSFVSGVIGYVYLFYHFRKTKTL